MEVTQVVNRFTGMGYELLHATKKTVAYRASKTRRVVYLRKDSGLPGRVRLIVDPAIDLEPIFDLDGVGCPKKTLAAWLEPAASSEASTYWSTGNPLWRRDRRLHARRCGPGAIVA